MLTPHEVDKLIADSTPSVLIALDELHNQELAEILARSSVRQVFTTSAVDWQNEDDSRLLSAVRLTTPPGAHDLAHLIDVYDGRIPARLPASDDDVAVITYTSGTTGAPKGAMNTHRNVETGGFAYRDWFGLGAHDVVLGVAPLFHVTGLTGHIACSIAACASLVLSYRFHVDATVDMIRRHRPTFTVGAITVFVALGESPKVETADLASLSKIASGGAPVAAATAERFRQRFGTAIHNVYCMTETTSPVLAVPLGKAAPIEAQTQALSVGVPMLSARVTVMDDNGMLLPPGELGELAVAGPQIVPGYWRNVEATKSAMRSGWMLTGDVGYADDNGWFYLVDRKKDMIVASGYKVWPPRGRGCALHTRGGSGSRCGRCPGSVPRRNGEGIRVVAQRIFLDSEGTHRILPGPFGRLQVPATGRNCRRHSEDCHRQDPAPTTP
jgi:long-chain acyl-CoA synthetase